MEWNSRALVIDIKIRKGYRMLRIKREYFSLSRSSPKSQHSEKVRID